jgi:hypothetical protein
MISARTCRSASSFLEESGPPEKVFNEFWKPSRGCLGARRGRKVALGLTIPDKMLALADEVIE